MQALIGTGVALVTPFKKDFSVDVASLIKIVNYQIDKKLITNYQKYWHIIQKHLTK